MKNRLIGFLIILIFLFVGFFWLLGRETKNKINLENAEKGTGNTEKQIVLKKVEEKTNSGNLENEENFSGDFAYFNVNNEKFYFNIIGEKLELKNDEKILGLFDVVLKNDLKISEIFGVEKNFLIEIGEKKYIFSKDLGILKDFETKLSITYAKNSLGNYIFFSKGKGVFVLYKEKNELEYFSLFSDFVFYKSGYIGIISSEDTEKKSRFDLYGKNIVFYFDPKTEDKKIIYDLDFFPKKIYEFEGKIFLENEKNEKFSLENF